MLINLPTPAKHREKKYMREYISTNYINKILNGFLGDSFGAEHFAYNRVLKALKDIPESDVVYMYTCSVCGEMTSEEYQFCPYCGKPMK